MKSIVETKLLLAGIVLTVGVLAVGGCGRSDNGPTRVSDQPVTTEVAVASDRPVKLGDPFKIGEVRYTPADIADYDDVGYASWYGAEFAGRPTANGEIYNPDGFSAAHKTLPLPSYVEVTALDTGRTILVRVNDRGPMRNDRLIDLSQAAARQLGIADRPTAVRVRRTSPVESERAQLRAGLAVAERRPTSDTLLAILRKKAAELPAPKSDAVAIVPETSTIPKREDIVGSKPGDRFVVEKDATPTSATTRPESKPVDTPTTSRGDYVVQVAAFSSRGRADAAAKAVGGSVSQAGSFWRVRIGPFSSETDAQPALARAKAKGFGDARVMRDR